MTTPRETDRAEARRYTGGPAQKRPAMPLFWKPYRSDVTDFIAKLKKRDPQLEERQRQGRALLWDRSPDRELSETAADSKVAQQPYVYQTKV
jgi:hypothetical protein